MSDTIKELKKKLAEEPKDAALWLALGNAYVEAGQLEDAIDAFSEGIICNPFGVDCYHMRARKYLTLRKCEFSVADFAMAARLWIRITSTTTITRALPPIWEKCMIRRKKRC